MKTETFEKTVKIGDRIIVYTEHYRTKQDTRNFIFTGYVPCTSCGFLCPGFVKLLNTQTKIETTGCYRNSKNIRLEIKPQESFLPDDLFEV